MRRTGPSLVSQRKQLTLRALLPNVKIITDPEKLAHLKAQAAKDKNGGPTPKRRLT